MLKHFSVEGWYWTSFCLAPFLSLAVAAVLGAVARRKHSKLRSSAFALVAFCATFTLTLVSVRIPLFFLDKTGQASAGAHDVLDQLPVIPGIELAAVQDTSFFSDLGECCCSYGRLYLLFGTSHLRQEALDRFAQELIASGWHAQGRQYETSWVLARGTHELINISYGGDGGAVWLRGIHPEYQAAQSRYTYLLDARVDYLIPSREECGH